jgi:predicted site-specific integrase-resolvase
MVEDLLAIVHTFSCRLYGLRKYQRQIKDDFPECSASQPKALCE